MKKLSIMAILVLLCVAIFSSAAHAAIFSYSFNPKSLDHGGAYYWGLTGLLGPGESIVSASFTFFGINNYKIEPKDIIYVTLLDDFKYGEKFKKLNDNKKGDYFNGKGKHIFDYTDDNEDRVWKWTNIKKGKGKWVNVNNPEKFVYTFTQGDINALMDALQDGTFAFGIDSDCHYSTAGLTFQFETSTVPEPATMALLGMGIAGLVLRRKKRV